VEINHNAIKFFCKEKSKKFNCGCSTLPLLAFVDFQKINPQTNQKLDQKLKILD